MLRWGSRKLRVALAITRPRVRFCVVVCPGVVYVLRERQGGIRQPLFSALICGTEYERLTVPPLNTPLWRSRARTITQNNPIGS